MAREVRRFAKSYADTEKLVNDIQSCRRLPLVEDREDEMRRMNGHLWPVPYLEVAGLLGVPMGVSISQWVIHHRVVPVKDDPALCGK